MKNKDRSKIDDFCPTTSNDYNKTEEDQISVSMIIAAFSKIPSLLKNCPAIGTFKYVPLDNKTT